MNDKKYGTAPSHTQAWIFQTWLSFIVSISATSLGVIYLPVDPWVYYLASVPPLIYQKLSAMSKNLNA